jgi:hypothetical protein
MLSMPLCWITPADVQSVCLQQLLAQCSAAVNDRLLLLPAVAGCL